MADKIHWEYTVQTLGTTFHAPKNDELQAVLNSLGEQGWEIFSVVNMDSKVRLVAKRPLTTPVRRRSSWPG